MKPFYRQERPQVINDIPEFGTTAFHDAGVDPRFEGQIRRNGPNLRWHDGYMAVSLNLSTVRQKWYQQLDVVSTAAQTDILDSVPSPGNDTIPAGRMGIDGSIHVVMGGDYLNNSGATRTFTLKAWLNATTMWEDASDALAASATRRPWWMHVTWAAQDSAAVQVVNGVFVMGEPGNAAVGLGNLAAPIPAIHCVFFGTAAIDSDANALTPQITFTHSVSNANLSFRRQWGWMTFG